MFVAFSPLFPSFSILLCMSMAFLFNLTRWHGMAWDELTLVTLEMPLR